MFALRPSAVFCKSAFITAKGCEKAHLARLSTRPNKAMLSKLTRKCSSNVAAM